MDTPEQFAGYRISARIAAGAHGEVFRAEEPETARIVALKLCKLDPARAADPHVAWRFQREAKAVTSLEHVNVATVFASGIEAGVPWLAMELVEGLPIDAHADALALRGKLNVFLAVCDAVQHAHSRGVIHRDLKPGNILVRAADGVPKVLDFGLARFLDDAGIGSTLSLDGQPLGTPMFMPPEQIAGSASPEVTADIYSLGVILFRLLDGGWPFDETLPPFLLLAAARDTEPRLPKVERDLACIIIKATARERGERYPSVTEFAGDIRRFLAGDPVLARRGAFTYRLRKWTRKHWRPLALAAALIIIGAVVASAWIRERREAEERRQLAFRQAKEILNAALLDIYEELDGVGQGELIKQAAERIAQLPWDDGSLDLHRFHAMAAEIRGHALLSKSQPGPAGTAFREARTHFAAMPETPQNLADSARIIVALARSQMDLQQIDAALENSEKIKAILARTDAKLPGVILTTIATHTIRAEVFTRKGRADDAEREFAAAAQLADTAPDLDTTARVTLAALAWNNLADAQLAAGKNTAASDSTRRAEAHARGVIDQFHDHYELAMQLGRAMQNHTLLFIAEGKLADAQRTYDDARIQNRSHRALHQATMLAAELKLARTGLAFARAQSAAGLDAAPTFTAALEDANPTHSRTTNVKINSQLAEIETAQADYREKIGDLQGAAESLRYAAGHEKACIPNNHGPELHFRIATLYLRINALPRLPNSRNLDGRMLRVEEALTEAARFPLQSEAQKQRYAQLRAMLEKAKMGSAP